MELKKDGFFNQIGESARSRTDLRVGRQRFLVCGPGSKSGKSYWAWTGAAILTQVFITFG
jgi:hypothetical protein